MLLIPPLTELNRLFYLVINLLFMKIKTKNGPKNKGNIQNDNKKSGQINRIRHSQIRFCACSVSQKLTMAVKIKKRETQKGKPMSRVSRPLRSQMRAIPAGARGWDKMM